MYEHGGHEDLRGSDRRSVIPYVHGRTELYCSNLYEQEHFSPTMNLFLTHVKRCLLGPFITQGRVVTMRPGGPAGGPEVVEILYNIYDPND
jgi:hypothetical protein